MTEDGIKYLNLFTHKTEKYSIDDWMYDNDSYIGSGKFWRIIAIRKPGRYFVYDVALMWNKPGSVILEHYGYLSWVFEHELRPVTKFKDILQCLASDLQEKHDKILQEAKKTKEDIDALMRTRQLLKEDKIQIGYFETAKDEDGFARVRINVPIELLCVA